MSLDSNDKKGGLIALYVIVAIVGGFGIAISGWPTSLLGSLALLLAFVFAPRVFGKPGKIKEMDKQTKVGTYIWYGAFWVAGIIGAITTYLYSTGQIA